MYSEDDFLQLSALQHFVFCKRQCALIHIEQAWSENVLTAEDRIMHENVHEERAENLAGIRIVWGMSLHSFELGLSGKADMVEFHKIKNCGKWKPFPVECKRGKPKADDSDKIQLCAQALCLEEMMKVKIGDGAQWTQMRKKLIDEIDPERDSLRFYFLGSNWKHRVEHIGAKEIIDLDGPLIL